MKDVANLQKVIKRLHGCRSTHAGSVEVTETFQGQTAWEGTVEVFDLENHAQAKQGYAWSFENNGKTEYVTVLQLPPVKDAQTAVQAYLVSQSR